MSDHIGNVTQRLRAIPPERFRQKVARTVGGLVLAGLGAGLLYAVNGNLLPKNVWLERVGIAAIALGFGSASFEFIKAPVDYALAVARTILDLVRGTRGAS